MGAKNKKAAAAKKKNGNWAPLVVPLLVVGAALLFAFVLKQQQDQAQNPLSATPEERNAPSRAKKAEAAAAAEARRKTAAARVQADLKREGEVVVGNKTYHASFGIFPVGCKWRTVTEDGSEDVQYQYWNASTDSWTSTLPAECSPTGFDSSTQPQGWDFHKGTPRSEVGPFKQEHTAQEFHQCVH